MSEEIAIPVVVGLLVKDGRVLMGERRPDKVYPLHWEFPGGKVEAGETLIEALARELREELSIEIDTSVDEWDYEIARYSDNKVYAVHYFIVRAFSGEIFDREFARVGWFTQEELPALLHLTGNANVLARIAKEGVPR